MINKITYNDLISKGARIIENLGWYAERPKVDGYMFAGKARLGLGDIEFVFKLWHHGPEPEDMTDEEAEDYAFLDAIIRDGRYYDYYWYTVTLADRSLWFHPTGWFRDQELRRIVDDERRTFTESRLIELGFERII